MHKKTDIKLSNLSWHTESQEYGACSYLLNDKRIEHRFSKITPTKIGQFVTIWKRNNQGITAPYHEKDDLDFIIIASQSEDKIGLFVFPKSILINQGIISTEKKEGKRGIRVYPPWDNAENKQAIKTQAWQLKYFLELPLKDISLFNKIMS